MFTVVRRPVRGSLQTCGRWLGVAALTASSIAAVLIGFVNGEPAGAAVPTVGGTCGFLLGAPLVTGAAGSAGLEFPVYPANPHQVCQVKVTALASLTPVSGGSYSNVTHDPSSQTFTLDFAGGPLPLGILWQWSPHCADPVTPGVFTLTVNGQNFDSCSQVSIGGNVLATSFVSASQLTATVPTSALAGAGAIPVTVTTAGGQLSNVIT